MTGRTNMRSGHLKLAIVDDEGLARDRLKSMVAEIGGWDIVAEASHGAEALDKLLADPPDAVLLDIRMPGIDGMEVAAQLAALNPPPTVVFTTAYDDYAVNAFDTEAVAYLLKPVRRERLLQALARAAKTSRMRQAHWLDNHPELAPREAIPVSHAGTIKMIALNDIVSFHADQKYVRIVHADGEALIDDALKQLEEEFARDFVRIHRNSLVRLSQIAALTTGSDGQLNVSMRNSQNSYPVSRRHAAHLKQLLREHN
jgi:two-component system response regulator AlgR